MNQPELSLNDKFLIFSNESREDDSVTIIGRHIEELGELVYEKGHQIIVQQECNRLLSVYLTHLNHNSDLSENVDNIENFINRKRNEEDEIEKIKTTNNVVKSINTKLEEMSTRESGNKTPPNHKISFTSIIFVTILAMIWFQQYHLTKDIQAIRHHNNLSESHDDLSLEQLEIMRITLQEIVSLQKGAIKNLNTLQEIINKNHQALTKQNELDVKDMNQLFITTNNLVKTESDIIMSHWITYKEMLLNNPEKKTTYFLSQRNLKLVINTPTMLEIICTKLSTRSSSVYFDNYAPPLESINGMEAKKKAFVEFLNLLQTGHPGIQSKTVISRKLRHFFSTDIRRFLYKPTGEELMKMRRSFKNKYDLLNTVGTTIFLRTADYIAIALVNRRIVGWNRGISYEQALTNLHSNLTVHMNWEKDMKLLIPTYPREMSDIFVINRRYDITEGHIYRNFLENNFGFLLARNSRIYEDCVLGVYHLILEAYEESL